MNPNLLEIVNVFSESPSDLSVFEDTHQMELTFGVTKTDMHLPSSFPLEQIAARDGMTIRWNYMELDDEDNVAYMSEKGNWLNFKTDYDDVDAGEDLMIKVAINKKIDNHILSVYDYDSFVGFLESKSLSQFMGIFNNALDKNICFEVQDEKFQEWHTDTIAFVPRGSETFGDFNLVEDYRTRRLANQKDICYTDSVISSHLIPEDFFVSNLRDNDKLQKIFMHVNFLMCLMFLFDSSKLRVDTLQFKLAGLRSYPNTVFYTSRIGSVNVPIELEFYSIYKWVYSNGDIFDKIGIARNIISLNFDPNSFALKNGTFPSILSNYHVYEKENSLQYIELRNKISEILIDLQDKINKITDDYLADMRKNLFTIVSFILTTIVVRTLSHQGDIMGGFSKPILAIIFGLLIASIVYLYLCRCEIKRKINLFEKHYGQIKNRYNALLCKTELENVFKDCNPNQNGSHSSVLRSQMNQITWCWVFIVFVMFVAMGIVAYINIWH